MSDNHTFKVKGRDKPRLPKGERSRREIKNSQLQVCEEEDSGGEGTKALSHWSAQPKNGCFRTLRVSSDFWRQSSAMGSVVRL